MYRIKDELDGYEAELSKISSTISKNKNVDLNQDDDEDDLNSKKSKIKYCDIHPDMQKFI